MTYKDGIRDPSVMPSQYFQGNWVPMSDSGWFTSDTVNGKKPDGDDHSGVVIDESQISIAYRYKNSIDKDITYSLTVQRSTGRFAESFLEGTKQSPPFLDGTGRCVVQESQ